MTTNMSVRRASILPLSDRFEIEQTEYLEQFNGALCRAGKLRLTVESDCSGPYADRTAAIAKQAAHEGA